MKNRKYPEDLLKELFSYTLGEDIANAVSHCIGSFFGLVALVSLAWIAGRYGDAIDAAAFIFYGCAILFLFLMSTLYHSMINPTARIVFKRLDHIAIYILILGSYTPYVFSVLRTPMAYLVYVILAIVTVIGIILKALYAGRYDKTSTLIYVLMGWAALFIFPQLFKIMPYYGLFFMVLGGAVYTIGALIYAFATFKFSHALWHVFVIFGALFQYVSIAFYILQYK